MTDEQDALLLRIEQAQQDLSCGLDRFSDGLDRLGVSLDKVGKNMDALEEAVQGVMRVTPEQRRARLRIA